MNKDEISKLFYYYSEGDGFNEFLEFDRVENKVSQCHDLHAFILFEKLGVCRYDEIVSAAEHDIIHLSVDTDKFAEVATPELILELSRCGIMYDDIEDVFTMFA